MTNKDKKKEVMPVAKVVVVVVAVVVFIIIYSQTSHQVIGTFKNIIINNCFQLGSVTIMCYCV